MATTINSFLFSIVVGICFFVCNVQSQQVFEICNRGCEYATISEFLDDANVATSDIPAMSIVRICGGGNFYGDARLITRPFIWESRDYCADFTASSKTSSSSSDSSSDSISDSTSESSDSTLDARPHFTSFDDSDRDDFKPVAPDTESTGPFPTRKRGRKAMKQGSSKSSKSSSSSSSSSSDSSSPFNMKTNNNNGSPAKSMANMKKQKQSPKIKEKGMKKLKNEQQEKHQHHQILKDQHANGDEIFIEEHQVLKDDSRIVVEKRQASITGKRSMKRRLFPKPASPSTSSSAGNSKSGSKSKSMSKPKFPISSRVRLLPIAGTFLYGAGNLDAGSRVVFNLGAGSDGSEFRGNHFSCDATIVTISIAIYISAAGGNVIERNYFESCYNGVFAAGSSYNNIRDNEFFVKPGNQTTTLFASSGVTINTNAATAVSLLPSQFNMIENNQFDLKGVLETMWRNLATSKVVSSTYHGCFVTAVDIYADKGLASAVVQPPNRYNTVQRNLVRSLGAPFAAVYIHSQADSPSPASPAGLTPFPNCDFLANNNRVLNNDITGVPIIIDQADANTIRENSIKNIRPLDPLERYYYAGAIAIYAGDGNCIKSNEMMGRGNAAVAPTAGIVIGENDPIYPKYAMPAGPYTCPSRRTVIEDNSVQGLCGLEMLQVEVQYTYTFRGNVINTCAYVTPFGAVNSPLPATRTCTPFPNAAICPELSLPVPNWPLATACSVDIAF